MKPIEFEGQNVVIAKNKPQYNPLPAHIDKDGTVTSCWEFTPEELAELNKTGKLYISQMTFNNPLQPINMYLDLKVVNVDEFVEKPFSDVELEFLRKAPMGAFRSFVNDPTWKKAFEFYNKKNEKKVSIGCLHCYRKVYFYCLNNNKFD